MRTDSMTQATDIQKVTVKPLMALMLAALALSIVYVVGLEPLPNLHNAFHDLRHATGFPCH